MGQWAVWSGVSKGVCVCNVEGCVCVGMFVCVIVVR